MFFSMIKKTLVFIDFGSIWSPQGPPGWPSGTPSGIHATIKKPLFFQVLRAFGVTEWDISNSHRRLNYFFLFCNFQRGLRGPPRLSFWPFGTPLGALGVSFGISWEVFGRLGGSLGGSLDFLGVLWALRGSLGSSWGLFGPPR